MKVKVNRGASGLKDSDWLWETAPPPSKAVCSQTDVLFEYFLSRDQGVSSHLCLVSIQERWGRTALGMSPLCVSAAPWCHNSPLGVGLEKSCAINQIKSKVICNPKRGTEVLSTIVMMHYGEKKIPHLVSLSELKPDYICRARANMIDGCVTQWWTVMTFD